MLSLKLLVNKRVNSQNCLSDLLWYLFLEKNIKPIYKLYNFNYE